MSKEDKNLKKLIHKVSKCIGTLGVEKTEEILKRGLDLSDPYDEEFIDYIVGKACMAFQTSIEEVKNKRKKGRLSDYQVDARDLAFILIKEHLDFSNAEIARYFGYHRNMVTKSLKRFEYMDDKIPPDKDFLDKYEELNKEINQKKEELIEKHRTNEN